MLPDIAGRVNDQGEKHGLEIEALYQAVTRLGEKCYFAKICECHCPTTGVYPRTQGLCRLLPAPAGGRTFPTLSLRIFPNVPGPIPRRPPRCFHSFLPSGLRPSPISQRVGAPQKSWTATSVQGVFSGLQPFHHVQARQFACHPGSSHRRALSGSGQPWLLLPGSPRFVTSPWSGYARRPIRAIDARETSTPQDSQPCRLLHKT